MPKAIWNGKVIAEAGEKEIEIVEGNVYFPRSAISKDFFKNSDHHTTCGWKGEASYFHVEVDGETNRNAAWYYPDPKDAAKNITDFVAFWKGITIEKD